MTKFIIGVITGAALVVVVNEVLVWEVKIPPTTRDKPIPAVKIRAEVKEPQLYELMLLMPTVDNTKNVRK